MKRYRRWIAAGLVVVGSSVSRESLVASGEVRWLSFETIDQSALPIVRARLNGSGGHRLVLDAGFNDFVLDTTIVDGSGLKLVDQGEVAEIDFYGKKEKVSVAYLQKLEIGEVEFQGVRTLLVEGEDGTGIGGIRSYGRIGRELLEPLRLTIHYPRRLLYLEASPADEVPEGGVAFQSAGRFLMVPVQLVTKAEAVEEVLFVVDAGTSSTVIDRKWATEVGLAPKDATAATIERMQIGSFEAEGFPVLLGVMNELPYDGQPVGVIGADLLLSSAITYDFAKDRIWLVKVES
ncbi:MAG TPA: hypothetical protein VLK65_28420 [Vicinamibacteria bacterium]|nr:hypothetical protein [Vicinamibacteria bacterium]